MRPTIRTLPAFVDLRAFLAWAKEQWDVLCLPDAISLKHEMTALQLAALRAKGPILRFDAALAGPGEGALMPVIGNLFGTVDRVAAGLGLTLDQVPAFGGFLAALRSPPPVDGFRDALSRWPMLKAALTTRPKRLRHAPVQEVEAPIDMGRIPVPTPWPEDAGPLITWPVVMTRPYGSAPDAGGHCPWRRPGHLAGRSAALAEIIIEGWVHPGATAPEGRFGDHTGYYNTVENFPVMRISAITHRHAGPAGDPRANPRNPRSVVAACRLFLPDGRCADCQALSGAGAARDDGAASGGCAMTKRVILGVSGASGAALALAAARVLRDAGVAVDLVLSPMAERTLTLEFGPGAQADLVALVENVYAVTDLGATIASGSYPVAGIILPPVPAFSLRPQTTQKITTQIAARAVDLLHLSPPQANAWAPSIGD